MDLKSEESYRNANVELMLLRVVRSKREVEKEQGLSSGTVQWGKAKSWTSLSSTRDKMLRRVGDDATGGRASGGDV